VGEGVQWIGIDQDTFSVKINNWISTRPAFVIASPTSSVGVVDIYSGAPPGGAYAIPVWNLGPAGTVTLTSAGSTLGLVSTLAPSYTSGTYAPISLDNSGNLRIVGTLSTSSAGATELFATSSPPTYTNNTFAPFSSDLSGNLRVTTSSVGSSVLADIEYAPWAAPQGPIVGPTNPGPWAPYQAVLIAGSAGGQFGVPGVLRAIQTTTMTPQGTEWGLIVREAGVQRVSVSNAPTNLPGFNIQSGIAGVGIETILAAQQSVAPNNAVTLSEVDQSGGTVQSLAVTAYGTQTEGSTIARVALPALWAVRSQSNQGHTLNTYAYPALAISGELWTQVGSGGTNVANVSAAAPSAGDMGLVTRPIGPLSVSQFGSPWGFSPTTSAGVFAQQAGAWTTGRTWTLSSSGDSVLVHLDNGSVTVNQGSPGALSNPWNSLVFGTSVNAVAGYPPIQIAAIPPGYTFAQIPAGFGSLAVEGPLYGSDSVGNGTILLTDSGPLSTTLQAYINNGLGLSTAAETAIVEAVTYVKDSGGNTNQLSTSIDNTPVATSFQRLGALGGRANAAFPAWTEGRAVPSSTDLFGNTRSLYVAYLQSAGTNNITAIVLGATSVGVAIPKSTPIGALWVSPVVSAGVSATIVGQPVSVSQSGSPWGVSSTTSAGVFSQQAGTWNIGALTSITQSVGTSDLHFNLPTLMADATANPTLTQINAFSMGFNGSTWDRLRTFASNGVGLGALTVAPVVSAGVSATIVNSPTIAAITQSVGVSASVVGQPISTLTVDPTNPTTQRQAITSQTSAGVSFPFAKPDPTQNVQTRLFINNTTVLQGLTTAKAGLRAYITSVMFSHSAGGTYNQQVVTLYDGTSAVMDVPLSSGGTVAQAFPDPLFNSAQGVAWQVGLNKAGPVLVNAQGFYAP
jgi:hypothetical protein